MKSWDAIIIGGGIMGVSLALELGKFMERILVIDRGPAGREASYAAAGMLAAEDPELSPALRDFARASVLLYPQFLEGLENSGSGHVELSAAGTLYCAAPAASGEPTLSASRLAELQPGVDFPARGVVWLEESWLDPRQLMAAALQSAERQQVELRTDTVAVGIEIQQGKATAVFTSQGSLAAGLVVNCCGAWAAEVGPLHIPVRPVKGQMLTVAAPHGLELARVIRTPDVYLVPRGKGRILIGATVEEAGFDKSVEPAAIQRLLRLAAEFIPALAGAPVLDSWAGLRPGTPDGLPILGESGIGNYYLCTGHFRNGILLAPATAHVVSRLICGITPDFDPINFSFQRFARDPLPAIS